MSRPSTPEQGHFPDGTRFEPKATLGRGAFGTVFEIYDTERAVVLAGKVLHRDHPVALARFKHEFRAFADLHHPNLVRLYELHAHDGQWFFTMERLRGRDPLTWLNASTTPAATLDADTSPGPQSDAVETGPASSGHGAQDLDAARRLFAQIARGLRALHESGLLHRDLKPSNILVDDSGDAKLLDFGLSRPNSESDAAVVGTRGYIAPELMRGAAATPASDWFAVGVMLHEALAGCRPSTDADGSLKDSLPEPTAAGLVTLCQALLSDAPEDRPTGAEVAKVLGAQKGPEATWSGEPSPNFVGREDEQSQLHRAVAMSRVHSVVSLVVGPSGCGKSALARAVCADVTAQGGVVLRGRCFQQERLPLRALDSIVDALARQLGDDRFETPDVRRAMEAHAGALGRVFPVLRLVQCIADTDENFPLEPMEVRRQAFEGLEGILLALARTQPVVICIDDLQWGDTESATQLGELLARNAFPGILLLGTARSDERDDSDFFHVWDRILPRLANDGRFVELELPPLAASDCEAMAAALLGSGEADVDVAKLVREANGSPFFLEELIRQAQRSQPSTLGSVGSIREAVSARIETLSVEERRVFELVSVAGAPVGTAPLLRASGLGPAAWTALDTLRAAHLVRTRERTGALHVEAYHDRTRVASLELMEPASRRRMHCDLAEALAADDMPDDARVARHWVEGGEPSRAVEPAERAATAANEAFAFERAAELWEVAIGGLAQDTPRRRDVRRRRADALVNAGRAAEAAPELESLAKQGTDASDLRRAAEQWLTSGHVEHGTKVLGEALDQVGLSSPARPGTAMAKAMFWLPGVMLRRARVKSKLDPAKQEQVDVCWSAVRGLSSVDYVRGLYFVVLGMRLALSLGEPTRCARFGMFLAAQLRAMDTPGSTGLFNRYRDQASGQANPELSAYAEYLDGYVHIQQGRPRDAAASLRPALRRFENECRGVGWEITIGSNMLGEAIFQRGDINELRTFSEAARRRAESLGDINGIQGSLTFIGLVALADDRVADARRAYDELLSVWTVDGFHYPHFMSALCRSICDLYEGSPLDASAKLEAMAPGLRESGLGRAPYVRASLLARQAGCALAVLGSAPDDAPALQEAHKTLSTLEAIRRDDSRAEAAQHRAALSWIGGDEDEARRRLAVAKTRFEALGMLGRAHVCALRLAQVSAGDPESAAAALRALGVREPYAWAAAYAPGFRPGERGIPYPETETQARPQAGSADPRD